MCYDRPVLAHALETGLGVQDGYLYLRKIVQQTLAMPLPEPFDLRLAMIDKATDYFGSVHERQLTPSEASEIRDAINERGERSEEHTSELQLLMRISYAVFCLKKKHRQT